MDYFPKYTSYRLRTQTGTDLALRLCDSPGTRLTMVDMFFILDGHVPDRYQVLPRLLLDYVHVKRFYLIILNYGRIT